MKPLFFRLLFLSAALLLGETTARAEMITFSYSWDVNPSSVIQGLSGSTGSVQVAPVTPGTTPQFPLGPPPAGGTAIQAAYVSTFGSATSTSPDHFNTSFDLILKLTDTASNKSGILTFTGHLAGTMTGTSSELFATFADSHGNALQQLTLGNHVYSVTMDTNPLHLPAPDANRVLLGALVSVTNADSGSGPPGGGIPQPEPSTLILGATAVAGLALRRLTRSRK